MSIKSILLSAVFCSVFAFIGSSQFSIYGKYQPNQIEWQDEWKDLLSEDVVYENSLSVGVAYWLRLKNYRVEFHPGVYYTRSEQSISLYNSVLANPAIPDITEVSFNGFGFEVPVHFYFLDIEGDCNCPTFSKQGNIFSKGLYAYINPGVRRMEYAVTSAEPNGSLSVTETETLFTIAGGFGLDIGLGDLLTITPYTGLEFVPNMTWSAFDAYAEQLSTNAIKDSRNLRSIVLGLRLSVRPDYVKEQKGMFR